MKSLRIFLAAGGILLVLYIIAQLNRPKAVDWRATFFDDEKKPFDTYILYSRLKDLFPGSDIIASRHPAYNVIAEDAVNNASYLIVCNRIDPAKADYDQLIKYIKKGNDVFIAAGSFGTLFDKNLKVNTGNNFNIGNEGTPVHFLSRYLYPKKNFNVGKGVGNSYFSQFDTVRATVISQTSQGDANFIKYSLGKGSLYLSAEPKFFTNYSLLKAPGAQYAATALSLIKSTHRIIWDEYYTRGDGGEDTLMRVFLKYPALQWAWYIALFGLLLFVLFEIKRRQRIIPVIEPLRNSTLDFVNVVGQVYYEKRDNANIAHKKIPISWTMNLLKS
jgi:hypothetical protein